MKEKEKRKYALNKRRTAEEKLSALFHAKKSATVFYKKGVCSVVKNAKKLCSVLSML